MAIRRVDLSGRKNVRLTKSEINSLIPRAALDIEAATKSILPILEKVRTGNESEILNLGVEFDGIKAPALRVPKTELAKALAELDPIVRQSLEIAIGRIRKVHENQKIGRAHV